MVDPAVNKPPPILTLINSRCFAVKCGPCIYLGSSRQASHGQPVQAHFSVLPKWFQTWCLEDMCLLLLGPFAVNYTTFGMYLSFRWFQITAVNGAILLPTRKDNAAQIEQGKLHKILHAKKGCAKPGVAAAGFPFSWLGSGICSSRHLGRCEEEHLLPNAVGQRHRERLHAGALAARLVLLPSWVDVDLCPVQVHILVALKI